MSISDDGHVRLMERSEQVPGQINMDGDVTPLPKTIQFNPVSTTAMK